MKHALRVGVGVVGASVVVLRGVGARADYAQTVLADHPVAYYRLDDTSE
jgi:hypothetical protein